MHDRCDAGCCRIAPHVALTLVCLDLLKTYEAEIGL